MGGSTSTTNQSSQQSTNQIPQWVNDASQQNYSFAQDIASRPLQQYQGQMVADISPQQQQAWNVAAEFGRRRSGSVSGLDRRLPWSARRDAATVTPQTLTRTDLGQPMNPATPRT